MTSEGVEPRAVGSIIHGRYRVMRIVGRGGLGTVYQVSDIMFGANTIFALKELADTNPGARKQFELESRWLRELNHDSIPKVRESFEWDGRVYLVMDFVDGENLEQYLHRTGRPLPEQLSLRWMLPICDALHYLHTRTPPLLHRDVKPANIIVTPNGHPVLVDFGIAKAHLPGMNQTVTFVRKAGTEGYAPPEQYAATGMTGPWSDVYALGATLYQLLVGRVPRTAVERITEMDPMPGPRELNPAISVLTDQAVMRALDLKPAARYQSVIEFAGALTGALRVLGGLGAPVTGTAAMPSYGAGAPLGARPTGQVVYPLSNPSGPRSGGPLPSLGEPLPSNLGGSGAQASYDGRGGQGVYAPVRSPAPPPMPAPMPSPMPTSSPPAPFPAPLAPPISAPRMAGRPPSPPGAESAQALEITPARSRAPLYVGLVVVLLLVVAGGAFYAYTHFGAVDRSTPSATVNGYFHALRSQDYNTAWSYNVDSRNNPGAQAAFTQGLQTDDTTYGVLRSATITQVTMTNTTTAMVTVSALRGNSQTPITYAVSVTQYSGTIWLITTIDTQ